MLYTTQVKSVKIWEKVGGETFHAGYCKQGCTVNSNKNPEPQQPQQPDTDNPQLLLPSETVGALGTAGMTSDFFRFSFQAVIVATVVNSLVLLAAVVAWSSSRYRRQCTACCVPPRFPEGRVGGSGGYSLADKSSEEEVEAVRLG